MSRVTGIFRYPVKSCRGEAVPTAVVEPWGLAGDRRWMLVDDDGSVVTAREANRLVLVRPEITPTGLRLGAPDVEPVDVARPDPAHQRPVRLWGSHLTAAAAGDVVDAWFTALLGRPAHLVWLDDPTRRPTNPTFTDAGDRVSFADGYPLLLTTEASLAALDDVVQARARKPRAPLPMTRFRPNVVVSGTEPWVEDDWRRIRIGGTTFRAVKGCPRCVLTTIDPATARREKEPVTSLARIRRFDGATWFGVNLVPHTSPDGTSTGTTLTVGDAVEVLQSVAPGDGPLRASTVENPVAPAP